MQLYPHQIQALNDTAFRNRVAFFHEMGLGKTFTGAEKMVQLGAKVNLVVCQKSKINDWMDHFNSNYPQYQVLNLTTLNGLKPFMSWRNANMYIVGIINYDLVWRRKELLDLSDFTLMLDESSLIQSDTAKRTKFILKLKASNVILLSGTPTGGKYEKLWTQLHLLGWEISKSAYWNTFILSHYEDYGGFPVKVVDGYKNVDRLKAKMRSNGCSFLKTDDVMDLPDQIFIKAKVETSKEYKTFRKDRIITVNGKQLVGDNTLTSMLHERQLCGQYSKAKLDAFKDLVQSTDDRLIVFYNFTAELHAMYSLDGVADRPQSLVNGEYKNLDAYELSDNSITFIQYQAGAMGLNLQKANKIIYFTPPLSSELYEQSKKRTNRIGQSKTCYYYNLIVKGSIEEKIYKVLEMRKDYTERLFKDEKI